MTSNRPHTTECLIFDDYNLSLEDFIIKIISDHRDNCDPKDKTSNTHMEECGGCCGNHENVHIFFTGDTTEFECGACGKKLVAYRDLRMNNMSNQKPHTTIDDWLNHTDEMVAQYDEASLTLSIKESINKILSKHIYRLFPNGGGKSHMETAELDVDEDNLERRLICGHCDKIIGRISLVVE